MTIWEDSSDAHCLELYTYMNYKHKWKHGNNSLKLKAKIPDCVLFWISTLNLSCSTNLLCWSSNLAFISWIWCCNAVISEWIKSWSFKSTRFSSSAAASNAKQAKRNMFNAVNKGFGAHCTTDLISSLFISFTSQRYHFGHTRHTGRPAMFLGSQGVRFCLRKKS